MMGSSLVIVILIVLIAAAYHFWPKAPKEKKEA